MRCGMGPMKPRCIRVVALPLLSSPSAIPSSSGVGVAHMSISPHSALWGATFVWPNVDTYARLPNDETSKSCITRYYIHSTASTLDLN